MNQEYIRNFCIIAHIDHGKSTLADRMLEITGTVAPEKMQPQMLDRNPIERERGITIKLQPVRMEYQAKNSKFETINSKQIQNSNDQNSKQFNKLDNLNLDIVSDLDISASDLSNSEYILNLIDTPGHVDFSYEVSRSLAAVEGAILLIDASQGVQAQTLANLHQAEKFNLAIIPVINKIDLPHSEPEKVALEITKLLNIDESEIIFASGKTGAGVEEILKAIICKIPPPKGDSAAPLRALIFDSVYDRHRGVISLVRIVDGSVTGGEEIELISNNASNIIQEVGIFNPDQLPRDSLATGEIGYIVTGFKDIRKVRVGDTVTKSKDKREKIKNGESGVYTVDNFLLPLPGYNPPKPMVYASVFPHSPADYPLLRNSLDKYLLTDGSLSVEPENSPVLGFGYRFGFLGLLHVEIVSERLNREYGLDLIITTPQVEYHILQTDNTQKIVHNISDLPDISKIKEIQEPIVNLEILSPITYLGKIIELVQSQRGQLGNTDYLNADTCIYKAQIPLSELIVNFYDDLKSITSGYGSMSYDIVGFAPAKLERLDIIVADEKIAALSALIPTEFVEKVAREKVAKLKEIVPRQQFEVKIQAALGGRVIASERISALRKDVTAKLYGGDVTRKRKLLEKQSAGKKRMRQFGKINLPNDVFIKLLKR